MKKPQPSPASPPNGARTGKAATHASAREAATPRSGEGAQRPTLDAARPNGRRNDSSREARLKPNGHAALGRTPGLAGSDDAGGTHAENAAEPPAATAPREACAEPAGSGKAAAGRSAGKRKHPGRQPEGLRPEFIPGPGDDVSQMLDATDFVNAVSSYQNLVGVYVGLLRSADEKIRQRAVERALEMTFGKGSAPPEEIVEVEVTTPRPKRGL